MGSWLSIHYAKVITRDCITLIGELPLTLSLTCIYGRGRDQYVGSTTPTQSIRVVKYAECINAVPCKKVLNMTQKLRGLQNTPFIAITPTLQPRELMRIAGLSEHRHLERTLRLEIPCQIGIFKHSLYLKALNCEEKWLMLNWIIWITSQYLEPSSVEMNNVE